MVTPATHPVPSAFVVAHLEAGARGQRVLQDRVTGAVLAAFFTVHRELGGGFLTGVYQRALALEFLQRGLTVEQEAAMSVFYKGTKVGQYRAPFIVDGRVLVELATGDRIAPHEERQLATCLHASTCSSALLLHFGATATFRHVERAE